MSDSYSEPRPPIDLTAAVPANGLNVKTRLTFNRCQACRASRDLTGLILALQQRSTPPLTARC
jgi:hypothetical protein